MTSLACVLMAIAGLASWQAQPASSAADAGGADSAWPPERLRVVIRADSPAAAIPKTLWGHALPASPAEREAFFLAELLPNRSFESPPFAATRSGGRNGDPNGDPDDAPDGGGSRETLTGWMRGDGSILERIAGPHPGSPGAIRLHGSIRSVGSLASSPRDSVDGPERPTRSPTPNPSDVRPLGGFRVEAGARLLLRVDARREGDAALRITLRGDDGASLASARLDPDDLVARADRVPREPQAAETPARWRSHGIPLTPRAHARAATLELRTEGEGDVLIDLVSLVPASTWRGHGLRRDRAEIVAALRPTLLALPHSIAMDERGPASSTERWRRTVGDIAERPGHRAAGPDGAAGGSWSIDGLGLFEALQWAEDLNADTLVALDPAAIDAAAELLEYANGSQQSPAGSIRANGGHPAPFGLRFAMWVDEHGPGGPSASGLRPIATELSAQATAALREEQARRSSPGRDADRRGGQGTQRAPAAAPSPRAPRTPNEENDGGVTLVAPPAFALRSVIGDLGLLWQRAHHLDRESRDGPPLAFVAWGVEAADATLDVALAEAAFLTALERHAGSVALAVHHRLLGSSTRGFSQLADGAANAEPRAGLLLAAQRNGDPLGDSATITTPAYWVHAMHANHRGDRVVPVELPALPLESPIGGVGIGARGVVAEFRQIRVSLPTKKGEKGEMEERSLDRVSAQPITGGWSRRDDGAVQVVDAMGEGSALTLLDTPFLAGARDYTLRLEARITEAPTPEAEVERPDGAIIERDRGDESPSDTSESRTAVMGSLGTGSFETSGLVVAFHARDAAHHTAWVVAGGAEVPGNRLHALERNDRGRVRLGQGVPVGRAPGAQHPPLELGRWYALEITCVDGRVRCSIDGVLIHDLDERQTPRVACSATILERTGETILCAVNATDESLDWSIEVRGIAHIARGELSVLSGPDLDAMNSPEEPDLIRPVRTVLPPSALPLPLTLPPRSVSFLRLLPADRP